jgi:membrane protease YdiL (CAAX protease family)
MLGNATTTALKTRGLMLWTFLPCAAMWVGLYQMKSAAWAYALYHVVCLMPVIIWGRALWQPTLVRPTLRDCGLILVATIVFSAATVLGYEVIGTHLLSRENVPVLLKGLGINRDFSILFALYGTIVNPLLEELFWRGVVLNQLERVQGRFKYFGITWSSLTYALFHYFIFRLVMYPGAAEVGTLLLAGYGAILAVIYRKTGSIITTALTHGLLTDLAVVVLLLYYIWKFGMPW